MGSASTLNPTLLALRHREAKHQMMYAMLKGHDPKLGHPEVHLFQSPAARVLAVRFSSVHSLLMVFSPCP